MAFFTCEVTVILFPINSILVIFLISFFYRDFALTQNKRDPQQR